MQVEMVDSWAKITSFSRRCAAEDRGQVLPLHNEARGQVLRSHNEWIALATFNKCLQTIRSCAIGGTNLRAVCGRLMDFELGEIPEQVMACDLGESVYNFSVILDSPSDDEIYYSVYDHGLWLEHPLFTFDISVSRGSVESGETSGAVQLEDRAKIKVTPTRLGSALGVDLQVVAEDIDNLTTIEKLALGAFVAGAICATLE